MTYILRFKDPITNREFEAEVVVKSDGETQYFTPLFVKSTPDQWILLTNNA